MKKVDKVFWFVVMVLLLCAGVALAQREPNQAEEDLMTARQLRGDLVIVANAAAALVEEADPPLKPDDPAVIISNILTAMVTDGPGAWTALAKPDARDEDDYSLEQLAIRKGELRAVQSERAKAEEVVTKLQAHETRVQEKIDAAETGEEVRE